MTDNTPILVRCFGMDERKESVFRMVFKMHSRRPFHLLESADHRNADLAIVDIDGPNNRDLATKLHQSNPSQRLLVTSVSPPADGIFPVLPKPVRMETLFSILNSIFPLDFIAPSVVPDAVPDRVVSDRVAPTVILPEVSPLANDLSRVVSSVSSHRPNVSKAEEHTDTSAKIHAPVFRMDQAQSFNPEDGLLGLLQVVQRHQMTTVLADSNQQAVFYLDPVTDRAEVFMEEEPLRRLCQESTVNLRMRTPRESDAVGQGISRSMSMQSLLWQVGAWTANGRWNQKLPMNAPIHLKRWPNLTRLAMLPESLRISAFLTRSPASPVVTIRMLHVDPSDLFNFLAATYSLGLLRDHVELVGSTSHVSPTVTPVAAEVPTEKRSFLSRILRRISGL